MGTIPYTHERHDYELVPTSQTRLTLMSQALIMNNTGRAPVCTVFYIIHISLSRPTHPRILIGPRPERPRPHTPRHMQQTCAEPHAAHATPISPLGRAVLLLVLAQALRLLRLALLEEGDELRQIDHLLMESER